VDDIETELEEALQAPERSIGDDGFSERVLARLPRRRCGLAVSPRWTLAAAAAMGSLLTLLLAPPVESAFGLLKTSSTVQTLVLTAAGFVTVIAIPLVWLFHAEIAAILARFFPYSRRR
jgi:hypothetical protein